MDGFETAALIRQRPRLRHMPIIFMTAGSDETHALRGYSLGAVDYILTPVVPEVLRTKVKVFVELFRMTDQLKRQAAEQRVALAEERAARATAEEAGRRAAFLADAGKRMSRSLDLDSTVESILRLRRAGDRRLRGAAAARRRRGSPEDPSARSGRRGQRGAAAGGRDAGRVPIALDPGGAGTGRSGRRPSRDSRVPLLARGTLVGVLGMTFEKSRPPADRVDQRVDRGSLRPGGHRRRQLPPVSGDPGSRRSKGSVPRHAGPRAAKPARPPSARRSASSTRSAAVTRLPGTRRGTPSGASCRT